MRVSFDRFDTYAKLTETLDAWAKQFPALLQLDSIGQSYEGREIAIATLTNLQTGPPDEKPAVFVHAQIHAMEFTGTTAALNLLDRLLHGHGEDERVTQALDTRTFYVVPRVNPDGAEAGLADGRFRRSSVRPYPRDEPHALFLALVSPKLELRSFESESIGDGAHRLRLVLENSGWLPTNVTQKALDRKAVRPIEVSLELPDGARVVTGKEREKAGQLQGRAERRAVMWWNVDHSTSDRTKLDWVVEAATGERVSVVARHERAGTVRAELVL